MISAPPTSNLVVRALLVPLLGAQALLGCGSAVARKPPGKPPTPATVTVAAPGGDAHDPHAAALQRQLSEPWGRRNDKDDQVHAPTPDWENWKRVKYWGVKHFTGFRYGDDHHVIGLVFVQAVEDGEPTDSESCMRRFEKWAWPQVRTYEVQLGRIGVRQSQWRDHPITVRYVDGSVDLGFDHYDFSAAWATYPAYPDACLAYSVAVPWRGHGELARKVRDRFVDEGFQQMRVLTEKGPRRQ